MLLSLISNSINNTTKTDSAAINSAATNSGSTMRPMPSVATEKQEVFFVMSQSQEGGIYRFFLYVVIPVLFERCKGVRIDRDKEEMLLELA